MRTLFILMLAFFAPGAFAAVDPEQDFFALEKRSLEQLLNLEVVTASRFSQPLMKAPATIFVLTERDIRALGAASVADLLRYVPGLDVMTAWDTEVEAGARGLNTLENAKLLVLLDGQRVNSEMSGGVRWKELPVLAEDIARIEVSLTPGSALYGADAFAGVVQIFTKPAAARRGLRLEARAGNKEDRAYSASYGWSSGKLDFALAAETDKTEGWGNRDPDKVRERVLPLGSNPDTKIKDWSEFSKIMFRADLPGEDRELSLRGGLVSGVLGSPAFLSAAGKAANNPMSAQNGHASLEYKHGLGDGAGIEASAGYFYWRNGGTIKPYTARRGGGEARYWSRLGERLRLTAGLAAEAGLGESPYFTRSYARDGLYAGYGQLELRPLEDLSLTGGLRYDKHLYMDGVFSPRGAAVFALAEGHSLHYGAGSSFRKASLQETYWRSAGDNPATSGIVLGQLGDPGGRRRPEKLVYHDLAYRGLLHERLSLRSGLFRYAVRDLIILHKVVPWPPYQYAVLYGNLQRLNITGGEAELRWDLPGACQAFGNISYQHLNYLSPIDTQRLSVPYGKWNAGLVWEKPRGPAGSLVIRHVGARKAQFGIPESDRVYFMNLGAYTVLDAKLAWSASAGRGTLEFGLTVLNVFDKKHMEYPVSDGSRNYFGANPNPALNLTDDQKRAYENRNALNDRRILADVKWRF